MPTLHLFGGGPLVAIASEIAQRYGWKASYRTSNRLWAPGSELASKLKALGVEAFVANELDAVMKLGPEPASGDIALSFGAPWIFRQRWLELWNGRAFNSHARRLPEHRGAGGPSWLILMGDREGMALIHELTAGIDDGPIVASRAFTYGPEVSLPRDYDRVDAERSATLVAEWLPKAFAGHIERRAQVEHVSTYWPRLNTGIHAWIDWDWTARDIVAFARAFDAPYDGARSYVRGRVVRLRAAELGDSRTYHPFQRGLVFRAGAEGIHVATRQGAVIFGELGFQDGEAVSVRVGDRCFTPRSLLEDALATRVTYLPDGEVRSECAAPPRSGT